MIYAACLPDELQIVNGGLYCDNWHFQPVTQFTLDMTAYEQDFKGGLSVTLAVFAAGFVIGVILSIMKKAR